MTASVDGRTNPCGLVGDEILAALNKLFPLGAPAIDGLAAAIVPIQKCGALRKRDARSEPTKPQRRATMGLGREQAVEIFAAPLFKPGEKVRSIKHVKNDGTYPGKEIGENLVRKGDVGYVRDIGIFLQQFYIYAVEFVDRAAIVGMRGRELVSIDNPPIKVALPSTEQEPAQ